MSLQIKMYGKLSPKMGFVIFKGLRILGMEGNVIWDCTIPGPVKCD